MNHSTLKQSRLLGIGAITALAALLLSACSPNTENGTDDVSHGFVEGAEELSEPLYRLTLAEDGGSTIYILDILSEEVTSLESPQPVIGLSADSRFSYAQLRDGGYFVVDAGVWGIDHGDHAHYYLNPITSLGVLEARGQSTLHAGASVIAVSSPGSEQVLYDRRAAEQAQLVLSAQFTALGQYGGAVPYRNGVVRYGADSPQGDYSFTLSENDGRERVAFEGSCIAVTAVAEYDGGVAFACRDSVVLIGHDAGREFARVVDFPAGFSDPEWFRAMSGGQEIVLGDAQQLLILDTTTAQFHALNLTGTAEAVLAPRGKSVLALGNDGVLRSVDRLDGTVLAELELPEGSDKVSIEVDLQRAYLALPQQRQIWEIDYADSLRIARIFELDFQPDFMVETGK